MSGRRIAVKLWGKHNRKAMIDPAATEGAVIGENVYWPDQTLVSVSEINNPTGGTSPDLPIEGDTWVGNTLWALILGIPNFIQSLASLTGLGFIVRSSVSGAAAERTFEALDQRVIITDGDGILANPVIGIADWPITKTSIEVGESWVIPLGFELMVDQDFDIEGEIDVEGELIILGSGIPDPIEPDFTYVSGDLTQIDYSAGEQKLFSYDISGDLEQVDFIQDGVTLRKSFFYSGGDLDYMTQVYL